MTIEEVLQRSVALSASDILLVAGLPVAYKVRGVITREGERLAPDVIAGCISGLYALHNRPLTKLTTTGDDDFSFGLPGLARFRVNAMRQRGSLGAIIRVVDFDLPQPQQMGVLPQVMAFAHQRRGLVLFTGPAGSGKTTTLACVVDEINTTRNTHVITIEDPIEYLHQHKMGVVTQRELSIDTVSYAAALRAALRQAPDVILLGEMRDGETIQAAITAAETGHLVFSTLHTLGAANTIDRIVDSFDPAQRQQVRTQLAQVLEGVVSQQLLSRPDGSLVPAFEVMGCNSAVRNMIREAKTHQLDTLIATSSSEGMCSMDQSILALVAAGEITAEEALRGCNNPEWMKKKIQSV